MTIQVAHAPVPTAALTRTERRDNRPGWGLLAPFAVLYVVFLFGPTVYGIVMSLFDTSLVRPGLSGFVGFSNYAATLTSPDFWASVWHTVLFTILTTPPLVVIALALAILTNRLRRGRWFFRLVFFAPFVVPVSVAALIFTWLYTPETGLYSSWLAAVGLPSPAWLGDPNWAMPSVAIMTIWWTLGFNFVLYLAGLQEIPRDLYEAAEIDGAGPWAQMRRITVPMLRRTTLLILVLQVIASLKLFGQSYVLFVSTWGPNNAGRSVVGYVYDTGFTDFRAGYGAAASTVYLVVLGLVAGIWLLVTRRSARKV